MADDVKRFYSEHYDEYARAIGHVCIAWSQLEAMINATFHYLAFHSSEESPGSRIICHNIDFREKIQIVMGMAHYGKHSDEWFSTLQKTMNDIDNLIRPERNRMVHDHWIYENEQMRRKTLRPGFKKPQAFQLECSTDHVEPIEVDDIWRLVEDIETSRGKLIASHSRYYDLDIDEQLREFEARSLHLEEQKPDRQERSVVTPVPPPWSSQE